LYFLIVLCVGVGVSPKVQAKLDLTQKPECRDDYRVRAWPVIKLAAAGAFILFTIPAAGCKWTVAFSFTATAGRRTG